MEPNKVDESGIQAVHCEITPYGGGMRSFSDESRAIGVVTDLSQSEGGVRLCIAIAKDGIHKDLLTKARGGFTLPWLKDLTPPHNGAHVDCRGWKWEEDGKVCAMLGAQTRPVSIFDDEPHRYDLNPKTIRNLELARRCMSLVMYAATRPGGWPKEVAEMIWSAGDLDEQYDYLHLSGCVS